MKKNFLEVRDFLVALFKHWVSLATGGVIAASVWFYKDVASNPVWDNLNMLLAVLFFGISAFQAWTDLRDKIAVVESEKVKLIIQLDDRKEEAERRQTKEKIKVHLAGFVDAARVLQNRCIQDYVAPLEDINSWINEVDLFLKLIGTVYQARFRNQSGIQPMSRTNMRSDDHRRGWEELHWRMGRLDEFMREEMEFQPSSFAEAG